MTDDPARDVDGRIGEAWSGEAPNGSHINLVVARRGSPTAAAVVGALASPRPGHVPFLACVEPGVVVRPTTVVVNKSTIDGDAARPHDVGRGAARDRPGGAGRGRGRRARRGDGGRRRAARGGVGRPGGARRGGGKEANRTATRAAIADALTAHPADVVLDVAARREQAHNAFFGEGG